MKASRRPNPGFRGEPCILSYIGNEYMGKILFPKSAAKLDHTEDHHWDEGEAKWIRDGTVYILYSYCIYHHIYFINFIVSNVIGAAHFRHIGHEDGILQLSKSADRKGRPLVGPLWIFWFLNVSCLMCV
jgi:hypothetical protein